MGNDQEAKNQKSLLRSWLNWAEWLAGTTAEMPAPHAFALSRLMAGTRGLLGDSPPAHPATAPTTTAEELKKSGEELHAEAVIATEETILGWMLEYPAMATGVCADFLAQLSTTEVVILMDERNRIRRDEHQMIAPTTDPDEDVRAPDNEDDEDDGDPQPDDFDDDRDEDEDDEPTYIGDALAYPEQRLAPAIDGDEKARMIRFFGGK